MVSVTKTLTQLPSSTAWLLHVSTDIAIFTVRNGRLEVLLRQRYSDTLNRSDWALPGGYIRPTEPLEHCAERTLAHQTGVTDVYMEQLFTFGRPDRHPRSRVITVGYFGLAPSHRADQVDASPNIKWHGAGALPRLYLDHADIIELALKRLAAKLDYSSIAFQLVPDVFTLGELQIVYETILGVTLDKRNFRKRILALEHVEDTGQHRRNRSHRPARLYRYTAPEQPHYFK